MAMDAPSMVQRSGDTLIVRSVVSGDQIFFDKETGKVVHSSPDDRFNPSESTLGLNSAQSEMPEELELPNTVKEEGLPQCKIKRNYSCNTCTFFTQNPRYFLTHLRDVHGEKIVINDCKLCLYASRHYQKLVRHMKMVHGSTEGIEDHAQARKRQLGRESRKRKIEEAIPNASLACQAVLAPVGKFEDTIAEEIPQNRLLKCSLCEFTTLYRAQLVEHEQDEHCKTKFFRCEKCTYVTHIKARFSKHVKYHSMPMIKCVTCDFRTPYKWNLDRHMKNHGGSGPFRCAACNFTADIKQSLTVHEMNHHVPPVGHAAGMSMARRKNKVGGTDIVEDFLSENGDLEDHLNNNNNIDDFDETLTKKYKYESDEQPTDLSQKSFQDSYNQNRKAVRPVPNLIPIQTAGAVLNLSKHFKELQAEKTQINELASFLLAENQISEILKSDKIEQPQLSPSSSGSATSKRKSVNFFDRLKETLPTDTDLICVCGHVSKCLSESLIHRNTCRRDDVEEKRLSASPINLSVNSGSTRCQYCRHRCKSSADLASHMKNCTEVGQCQNDSYDSLSDINDRHDEDGCDQNAEGSCKHPMENRIFVWNKLPGVKGDRYAVDQDGVNADYERSRTVNLNNENGYFGVETAPGYGEVTKKMTAEDEAANSSLKKVYKCPHCSFWASTASRFHVHIVGHLNKKPFECSFCAYRSNWRWDITKHIRLKTIRDPNHKIARVLMNDETGRRNYTKYNKYITLMKVTEEDGDPKLLKSGEMTPHQEASLAFINEYGNSMLKSKFSEGNMEDMKLHDAGTSASKTSLAANPNRFMKLPFFPTPMMGIMSSHKEQKEVVKRSPPPLIKATEDLIAQNIDIKQDGAEKRTLYKCKQCNYRNSSRDMVLSHVKEHFQEFGMNLNQNSNMPNSLQAAVNSNFYMKNMLAAMCLSSQQLSIVDKQGKLQQHSHLAGPLIPPSQHVLDSSTKPVLGTTNSSVAPLNLGITTKANEHGEVDEASSGVVTTTGTGVTGWRNPAPYRCGHCHQVSNWKHVIQRHCRLKHNSDIRIETVDRTSNKRSPTYHPLMTPSTCSSTNALISAANSSQNNIKLTSASSQEAIHSQTSTKTPVSSSSCDQEDNMIADMSAAKTFDSHTEPEASEKSKQKQHQCSSCSFVSESKSQMNYHVSLLHKNNLECYECHICCFPAINKQQLAHHIKISHGEEATGAEAIDLRAKNSKENDVLEKFAYFCHECPARYFGKKELTAHIKMHSEKFAYNCKFCSYSSRQEHDLLAHAVMHSDGYQDKTEKLCIKFKANSKHSRPKLKQLVLSAEENIWIVDRFSNSSNDLEDSIQKNIIDLGECNSFKPKSLLQAQLESSDKLELLPNDSFVGERCPDCPFETLNKEDYKTHIQCHLRISNRCEKFQCSCCDFSVPDEALLKEHMHLHVLPIFGSKSVNFYTRYDKLELNIVNGSESGGEYENVYRCDDERSSDDLDDGFAEDNPPNSRIILNAATGEIINSRDETPSANPF